MKNTFACIVAAVSICLIFLHPMTLEGKIKVKKNQQWVGTWATAPQLVEPNNMPPQPGLTGNSLREVVRVSIGGKYIRIKFSNEHSKSAVILKSVQIAASKGGSTIDQKSNKSLTFNSLKSVTLEPGAVIYSDPIKFTLTPRMDVAVTLYFEQTSQTVTGHPGSRTTSYIIKGNDPTVQDFTGAVSTDHWYVINNIEVIASKSAGAIAILGNSITDGRGSTTNEQNRWPDVFAERLLKNPATSKIGVLNMGIGGNCVLRGGLGPNANSRYERDILNQAGVKWAIVFIGVNDLGGVRSESAAASMYTNLVDSYTKMIAQAHAKNIKIYGATIMPFKGNGYYNTNSESARMKVNEWIRTSGAFDGVIDFDKVLQNPEDPSAMLSALDFQNDFLHPNAEGHALMGQFVDLKLFAK